jgi:hypothetical protein
LKIQAFRFVFRILQLLVYLLIGLTVFAQSNKPVTYSAEFGGMYSINNRAPFWLRSNQFGIVPDSGNTVFFRQNLHTKRDTSNKRFKVNAGAEMVAIVGEDVKLILPEVYLNMNFGKAQLLLGRKKLIHGFTDTTLSSGSVTWSGNALPLPEIQFSIPEYINIFNGNIGIKGHFSHAWFGNQQFARGYYLHQKSIYGRIGKPNGKIKLYGGVLHHVQWGGRPKYDIPEDKWLTVNQQFASGWHVYKDVVFPFNNPPRDSARVATFDFENRYGNHLGQVDIGGELNLAKFRWLFYKQLPFETGQTFSSLGNLDDGVYGISITAKKSESWFKKVVFEFVHTTNQGMYRSGFLRLIGYEGKHYGRNQNFYFNHAQYLDGWSYEGKTVGSPFLIPTPEIRDEKSYDTRNYFNNNNNIKAGYMGLITSVSGVIMEMRISLSKNFGSSANILEESANQLSFAHKMAVPIPKLGGIINLNVGIEQGDLIRDNYGIILSFKKVWD